MGSKGHARNLRKLASQYGPRGRKGLEQARTYRKGPVDPKTGKRYKKKK